MIGFLRKNFPSTVTSETVKKFSIAPNNESYVINALQFIGVIDAEGKRTAKGQEVFVLDDNAFPKAFEELILDSYNDLFELRGDDAWTLSKAQLTAHFRTSDKTSDAIGGRQAGVFQVFARLSGHEVNSISGGAGTTPRVKAKVSKPKATAQKPDKISKTVIPGEGKGLGSEKDKGARKDMAMTVRIEINLPANGSKETYDNIFKSIRANLIDD